MRAALITAAALTLAGCGGGMPLMYSAHATPAHEVTAGAGFSGTMLTSSFPVSGRADDVEALRAGALSPGIAPWIGARVGFGGGFDAGLTYGGRAVRVDGRKSFTLTDSTALSLGLGASGILPQRRKDSDLRLGGFGGELPLLVGWRSRAEIYSVWIGARGGAELVRGERQLPEDPSSPGILVNDPVSGWHAHAGGVVGLRVGFKYLFAVLEVDAAMHWARGEIAGRDVAVRQVGVAPAGALVARF